MCTISRGVLKEAELLYMMIGVFNTHNLEMLSAIIKAAVHQKTPVIIQTSYGAANHIRYKNLVAVRHSIAEKYGIGVVLHLDHARDYDEVRKAIDTGFNSIMFDGSSLPLRENTLGMKWVVDYARAHDVSMKAELGTVDGTEDGTAISQNDTCYMDPEDTVEFVKQTGIDILAVAVGTSHGQRKSKTNISFERLKELREVVDILLVIHGGTGVKDEDVKRVIDLGIHKSNVGTELLVGWSRKSRRCYNEYRGNISNRDDVVPYLSIITEIVGRKIHLFKNLDGE